MNKWIPVDEKKCELEGPYECSACGGHIMLDATFLDQVGLEVICPYCKQSVMCYGTDKLLKPEASDKLRISM